MDIVSLERDTFDSLVEWVDELARDAADGENSAGPRLGDLLDSADVCAILNINKRTLHTYRQKNLIAYMRLGNKFYYKACDVQRVINIRKSK